MAEEFTMPKLGLTMTDGTIREWLVDDGTFVQAGEPLLVIETDKVETEVEARADGVLRLVGVVGSTYECGAVIGYLLDEPTLEEPRLDLFGDQADAAPDTAASDMAASDIAASNMAALSPLDAAIAAADGLVVPEPAVDAEAAADERDEPDLDADPHLSDEAIAAELDQLVAPEPDEQPVEEARHEDSVTQPEQALGLDAAPEPLVEPAPAAAPLADIAVRGVGGRILASPRARAVAHDADLRLSTVAGSGPGGRIVYDDVIDAMAHAEAAQVEAERNHAERLEAARRADAERVEAERLEAERVEAERLEADRLEAERLEAERLEAERLEAERLEAERLEVQRLEAERLAALPPPPAAPELVEPSNVRPLTLAASRAQSDLPDLPSVAANQPVAATGGARLLADFLGVDLAEVGTSASGRVTREDVGAWVRARLALAADSTAVPAGSSPEPAAGLTAHASPANVASDADHFAPLLQEPLDVIPFRGMRGLIASRMHASLTEMAQLTLSVDVDMSGVNAERDRRRDQGQPVPGYTAWVVAAAAQAIEEHPYINSQITADGIALLPDVHVGVAVALDEGLIVPVIEHANLRTVEETHAVVADLAGRARIGKLQFEELEGATFSVTALGMFGVDMFTPVINPPNTAILGVGRLRSETGWSDGRPVEKTVMTLSMTWDHRAFDGAPAAEFAQTIVRLLQKPTELV